MVVLKPSKLTEIDVLQKMTISSYGQPVNIDVDSSPGGGHPILCGHLQFLHQPNVLAQLLVEIRQLLCLLEVFILENFARTGKA